jgi:hypothetical protein
MHANCVGSSEYVGMFQQGLCQRDLHFFVESAEDDSLDADLELENAVHQRRACPELAHRCLLQGFLQLHTTPDITAERHSRAQQPAEGEEKRWALAYMLHTCCIHTPKICSQTFVPC